MIRRLSEHVVMRPGDLEPSADFEQQGFVPRAVFPTGLIESGDSMNLYFGAADTCIGVTEFS